MDAPAAIAFDNSYARLPERFFARLAPETMPDPALVRLNAGLARGIGLDPDALAGPEGVALLAGQRIPPGAEPIAMAYAGHQFGNFVPQLGDGRAILLGEVVGPDGVRRDIQLKGSGRTPFSRMGDGRAVLGPVLREYIVGEAMAALGIPTTRALAALTTGERVWRERMLPGALLVRVARSHVRVGTFQYFAARGDAEALHLLVAHVLERHYPDRAGAALPALALLEAVVAAQARLVAQWMQVGFIHGVMNTDNMSVAGETIDYGPCAFMDHYDPEQVYSSIDHGGRYAYRNQPPVAHWNLSRLAQALLPAIDPEPARAVEPAQAAIDRFPDLFQQAMEPGLRAKLGLAGAEDGDTTLALDLMEIMAAQGADFTLAFRRLSALPAEPGAEGDAAFGALFRDGGAAVRPWLARWRVRLAAEGRGDAARQAAMKAANPAIIPRNHLVEAALAAAQDEGDPGPFDRLVEALAHPFRDRAQDDPLTLPPRPEQVVRATFCGT